MMYTFAGTEKLSPLCGSWTVEPSFVLLDQGDQFAEDLRDVAAVDLVDQTRCSRLSGS